jgi:hypothetical protein
MTTRSALFTLTFASLVGCTPKSTLQHVVLIDLKDDASTAALVVDCDRLLPQIPAVATYWCGTPATAPEFNRPGVDSQYNVALCVGFKSAEDYRAYLTHEDHLELVENWKPHMSWIRIHDVQIETSTSSPTTLAKP